MSLKQSAKLTLSLYWVGERSVHYTQVFTQFNDWRSVLVKSQDMKIRQVQTAILIWNICQLSEPRNLDESDTGAKMYGTEIDAKPYIDWKEKRLCGHSEARRWALEFSSPRRLRIGDPKFTHHTLKGRYISMTTLRVASIIPASFSQLGT